MGMRGYAGSRAEREDRAEESSKLTSPQFRLLKRAADAKPAIRTVYGRGGMTVARSLEKKGLITLTLIPWPRRGQRHRIELTDKGVTALLRAAEKRVKWMQPRWLSHSEQRELESLRTLIGRLSR